MVGILPDRSATYLQPCSLRSVDGWWDIPDFYPDTLMIMPAVYIFILIRCFNYPPVVIALLMFRPYFPHTDLWILLCILYLTSTNNECPDYFFESCEILSKVLCFGFTLSTFASVERDRVSSSSGSESTSDVLRVQNSVGSKVAVFCKCYSTFVYNIHACIKLRALLIYMPGRPQVCHIAAADGDGSCSTLDCGSL